MSTQRIPRIDPDPAAGPSPVTDDPGHNPDPITVSIRGWTAAEDNPLSLRAAESLVSPRLKLAFNDPATAMATATATANGAVTVTMTVVSTGIETLRIRASIGKDAAQRREEEIWLSLDEPSYAHHTLPYLEVLADPAARTFGIEFDLALNEGERLRWLSVEAGEVRNFRLHPGFPGGVGFRLPATVPAGATLWLAEFAVAPRAADRRSPAWQGALNWTPPRPKEATAPRDAIIFASWASERALPLGGWFLEMLKRRHPGAKYFFGINHGSSPAWERMILDSGLDADIAHAGPGLTMPYDPSGFVAALDAYRRSRERFRLAWFGHLKGGLHLDSPEYGETRWALERWFWDARDEVDRAFSRQDVGVWAPHWLMFQPEHLQQTDALRRMWDAPCRPLGAMAVSAHFVMRDECLRDFVDRVDPRFFTAGPEPFGGDRYFFEFAAPNIPLMQGWSADCPAGEGGTSGRPAAGGDSAILNDWRQNNAMMRSELARWQADPTRFIPRPVQHVTLWGKG